MKLARKILLASIATAALLGSPASAAIVVEDSFTGGSSILNGSASGGVYTVPEATLDLSAATVEKLVVAVAMRRHESFTVEYNGVSLNSAVIEVASNTNDGAAGIFYLDNPTLGGDLTITSSNAASDFNALRLYAFVLSGTAAGAPVFTDSYYEQSDDPATLTATVGSEGGFVIAAIGRNGGLGGVDAYATSPETLAESEGAQGFLAAWNATTAGDYSVTTTGNDHVGTIAQFGPVSGSGSPYTIWAATNAPTTGNDPTADEDADGVSNGVEFVVGGTISTNDLGKLPAVGDDGINMTFTFERDQNSIDASVSVDVEVGTDLGTWPASYTVGADTGSSDAGVTVSKDDPGAGTDTVTLTVVKSPDAKKFARLKVVITL